MCAISHNTLSQNSVNNNINIVNNINYLEAATAWNLLLNIICVGDRW